MFDAIVQAPNGLHYFFARGLYWRMDASTGQVGHWYPVRISEAWKGVPDNIDAAFRGRGATWNKIYFIKGRRYWRYDFTASKVDPGYPALINGNLKGYWDNGIDAVLDYRDYTQYLIRHDRVRTRRISDGTITREASPISDLFDGVPANIRAAANGLTGDASIMQFFVRNLRQEPAKPVDPRRETLVFDYDFSRGTPAGDRTLDTVWPDFARQLTADQLEAIRTFATDSKPSRFPNLSRGVVARQLYDRMVDPRAVNQHNSMFCGPAAVIYWLAKTRPDVYLKLVSDLFNTGSFRTFGETITPESEFLSTMPNPPEPGRLGIEEIDWMVFGAMRSHKGLMNNVDGDGTESGVSAGRMKYWSREILGYGNADINRCYAFGEDKALDDADAAFNREGVGFLQIHSSILSGTAKKKGKSDGVFSTLAQRAFGNHWVVYEGDYWCDKGGPSGTDGRFSYRVYSWGRIYHLDMGEAEFRDQLYASVNAY